MAILRSGASVPRPTLLLRPWNAGDIPQLLDIYSNPAQRQSARNPIVTEEDAYRWLEVQQRGWADGHRLSFAVLDSEVGDESGRVLGNIALKGWQPGKAAAEVGYWTAAAVRNRGIATWAVAMLTAWAFENFGAQGLQRLELLHQQHNLASCRVAQKSGYALIDVLPADPPAFPSPGHLHVRYAPGSAPNGDWKGIPDGERPVLDLP
jgi:RimJ/RimL family protein N-acetyltransferase